MASKTMFSLLRIHTISFSCCAPARQGEGHAITSCMPSRTSSEHPV